MKLLLIPAAAMVGLMLSCSRNPLDNISGKVGLDQPFNPNTAVEDLQEMAAGGNLDTVQAQILKTYMVRNGLLASESANATTSYRDLLTKALNAGFDGSDPAMPAASAEAAAAALVDVVILADSTTAAGHLVIVNVSVDNLSGKTINGLRGAIDIYDVFDDKIHTAEYRMLRPLGAGQRHQKVISIRLDQAVGANKILDYSGGVPLRVTWQPAEVKLQ